jgi:hypothetical protein
MHQASGEPVVRQILGVLSLVKKYGGATVEDACATALEMGARRASSILRHPAWEFTDLLPLSFRWEVVC